MLLAGWEVCEVKGCDQGLENAARGCRPRVAFQVQGHSFSLYRLTDWFCLSNFVIESAYVLSTNLWKKSLHVHWQSNSDTRQRKMY